MQTQASDPPAKISVPSLAHIRDEALNRAGHTRQLIAELDAWRNEIDATIAFLKAQQKE